MMVLDNKYNIGDFVYLKTDLEQSKRIVSRIILGNDSMIYELSCGIEISSHYDFEISKDIDVLVTSSN